MLPDPGPDEVLRSLVRLAAAPPQESSWLARCAQLLTDWLGTDGCLIFIVDPEHTHLELAVSYPPPPEPLPTLRLPYGFGVVGRVAADGIAAVLVDDRPRNDLHRRYLGLAEGQTVSRLCVPARDGGRTSQAVLALYQRAPRSFGPAESGHIQLMAAVLALRLARDRSEAAMEERREALDGITAASVYAQENERRRVAVELHDGVTQAVASLAFHLSAAEQSLQGAGPAFALDQVRAAKSLADLAFTEARHAIAGLRSPVLDDLGLAAALASLAGSVRRSTVVVDAADLQMPDHIATALYRIAQEAIQNADKHAGAAHIHVVLERRGPAVHLSIEDDGAGFSASPPAPPAGAEHWARPYGLAGMKERVDLLRGRLVLDSRPGAGTAVRVVVPLPPT